MLSFAATPPSQMATRPGDQARRLSSNGTASAASIVAAPYARPGRTIRVSVTSEGAELKTNSSTPAISANGLYAAFASDGSFVPEDANLVADIYVRSSETGQVVLVSLAGDGSQANGGSDQPALSADGRYVAFHGRATNLVPGDSNGFDDVFMRDRLTGVTELVSVGIAGAGANGYSEGPIVSADGRYVSFLSFASNFVSGDVNGVRDVFIRDRVTGVTELLSVGIDGGAGNMESVLHSISADGRYVTFDSRATNLVSGDTNGFRDIFVRDRSLGTTELVSVTSDGTQGNGDAGQPGISANGRYVVFSSAASNFVPSDTNGALDVFVKDRETGVLKRISVASSGGAGSGFLPAISGDGRWVAFVSGAANLVPEDNNNLLDIFVHDNELGVTERVSVSTEGTQANGFSSLPGVSADGRYVSFVSAATTLVSDDTTGGLGLDVFVRDRGPAIGVGQVTASFTCPLINVEGWATFSGTQVSSATDPDNDSGAGARDAGAELTEARLNYGAESADLLCRLGLAQLPSANGNAGLPGILYGLEFTHGGIRYELRASGPSSAGMFAIFRCDGSCTSVATLSGAIGTTAREIIIRLPLAALSADEGDALTVLRAFTAFGELATGAVQVLDEVSLVDLSIPTRSVVLGIAPAGTPEEQIVFNTPATLAGGNFSGTLDISSLSPGDYDVWARACLGVTCRPAGSLPLTISPSCVPPPVQLVSIVSRKTHGNSDFDVNLPLAGDPGVECRSGGELNTFNLIYTFNRNLAVAGTATKTQGGGIIGTVAIGPNPNQVTVPLRGVTNAQHVVVRLDGVQDIAGAILNDQVGRMDVLFGDVNSNRLVTNTDVAEVKTQVSSSVASSNFRNDVNANGIISNTDVSDTKAEVSTSLP